MQLDVLRGFSVLGIYWINVVIFGLPYGAYALPTLIGEAHEANLITWAFSEIFISGTMRGLFSMLFGASAMLLLDELRVASHGVSAVQHYYRRNLLLILFGLVHGYFLLWPYDVLYAYGLFGLFLFPLRRLAAQALLLAGCLLLLASDIEFIQPQVDDKDSFYSRVRTTQDDDADTGSWRQAAARAKTRQIESLQIQMEDNMELRRSGYRTIFMRQLDDVVDQQSTSLYQKHVFDIGGMMLIGMALFKLGVLNGRRSLRFYIALTVIGYASGVAFRGYSVYAELVHGFNLSSIDQRNLVDYDFSRLPLTLGHVGLVMLLCRSRFFTGFTRLLANVGRMALTNYILQTLVSIFLFYGFGLALIGEFERYQLVYLCAAMWVFQIALSTLWLARFRFGPLEWFWRSLTYGKRQPLRKLRV